MSPWSKLQAEFACNHDNTELRYKMDALDRRQYQLQCLRCGGFASTFISHTKVKNPKKIPAWDHVLPENYARKRDARRRELLEENSETFWDQYTAYLNSSEWRLKRRQVFKRDRDTCQSCLQNTATQVHHRSGSYRYWPLEPLYLLVSICDTCHDSITAIDRKEYDERDARRRAFLSR